MLISQLMETPIGRMLAITNEQALLLCEFADRPMLPEQMNRVERLFGALPTAGTHEILTQTQRELNEYFAASRETFTIPLAIDGTPFQESVWRELLCIPFGRTTSYERIAGRVGKAGAARAVGRANGDNRIAIIVPCHRVIGANGSLTGYGGGQHRKRWLLGHEQRGLQLPLV